MKLFGHTILVLSATQAATAKQALANAGHDVVEFATNEFDHAVAAAKQTIIGKTALSAIQVAEQPGLSGAQKMVEAIGVVAPVVLEYVAKGGFSGVITDVEEFARSVIESTLADVKATKAASIASIILKLLGLAK